MKKGYLLVFLAASMWGTLGIFAKLLYGFGLDPFTITFYRAIIAFGLLFVYNLSQGLQVKKHRLPFYAFYGFFAVFLFYILYFYTVKISSVSLAVLLLYSAPIYSTILGYFIFGERITPLKLAALLMAIMGCFIGSDKWNF
ncbi:MAG: drug/metabolite transporter, family [Thermococcaceae archaeon]|nr:drug/metabolite transporter, family [Thermococcaceae archaeon]